MKKKLLSILLAICMLCTLLPMSVLAATPAENEIKLELVKDSTTFPGKDVLRVDFKYKSGTDIPNNQMVYLKYDANKMYPAAATNGKDASVLATDFSKAGLANTFTANNYAYNNGFADTPSEVMLYTIIKGGFGYVCWKVTEPTDTPAFADFTRISSIFFGLKGGVTFDNLPKDIIKLATVAEDYTVTAQSNSISITVNGGEALMYGNKTAANNNLTVDLDKLFVAGDGVKFASSTPATYTVSFDANGGTGTMADVPNISGNYTLPANGFTAPSGQQFKGWATSASGTVITGTSITVSADTKLYAIWEPIPVTTYTVSFDANGGTGTMADVTGISGSYTLPANGFTAPSGKQFKGWATSAGGAVISGTTTNVTSDTTLYAIWEDIPVTTYTVSFDANGGTGTMADVTDISGSYTLPANGFTAPAGQQFKGWATSASGAVITGTSITVSADTKLYAIWEPIPVTTYTVSFDANGGTGTMADVTGISGSYTLPANGFTAPAGQQFKGWATSASGTVITGTSITVSTDTKLYAIWEPIPVTEYTITFNVNGGIGTIPSQTTSGQKLSSLPTATHSGSYSFVGWYASDGTQITTAYVFSANTTVYAHWTYTGGSVGVGSYTPSYSVSVDKTENGTITVSPKSASKGSIVTITVKPDKGYTLETLRALDMSGYAMELTENNGRFTFKMPASAVIVKATFMDDNTMLNFFVDVKASDYFYDAVLWAAEKGVTSGADALHFSPNAPCTRAQIVTFLWRAAGSPAPKNMSSFADVPADAFYAKAVAWAVENGITGGTGDGKFSPDATCTRAQAVTFLYRASGAPAVSGNSAFTDVASDAYYAAAVTWAEKNGITGGIGGGLFGSNDNCTRAQIVTFIYRSVK